MFCTHHTTGSLNLFPQPLDESPCVILIISFDSRQCFIWRAQHAGVFPGACPFWHAHSLSSNDLLRRPRPFYIRGPSSSLNFFIASAFCIFPTRPIHLFSRRLERNKRCAISGRCRLILICQDAVFPPYLFFFLHSHGSSR